MEETEEAEEAEEAEGPEGPKDSNERKEIDGLGPLDSDLSERIDQAVIECKVQSNNDVNRPLFMLAHKLRGIQEELDIRFSVDVLETVIYRWKFFSKQYVNDHHDYLTELLDKLSLVRFPEGHALAMALEIANGAAPPKKTERLSADVQLLASLCRELQRQAGNKPFFLDGRSAAKVLGRAHETVASWLRALQRLGVIRRVSRGCPGMASRYLYVT